jgi:hypothetical protein
LTWTSHVKNLDLVLTNKSGDQLRGLFNGKVGGVNHFVRLFLLHAETDCLRSSGARSAAVNDNSSIGIFDVLQSSLRETAMFQFFHWVSIWNSAEFIETSSWTPTASLDSVF